MKRFWLSSICAALITLTAFAVISAQAPVSTIQANSRVEYHLTYTGDGSPIRVIASETDVNNLTISVYTAAQMEAYRRGENVTPSGRATKIREDTLQYAAGSRVAGIYYVVVQNLAPNALTYRFSITGDGVTGVARAVPTGPPTTTQIIDQKGQRLLSVNAVFKNVTSTLQLPMPAEPTACTPANRVTNPVQASLKLCAGQVYAPMNIVGNNIALYSDDGHSAVVTSSGRQFAITLEGSNNWVEGVLIQARADPRDAGAWLCLYDECLFPTRPVTTTINGGILYGGGILLKGSNTTVHNITVRGGTIGIASVDGRSNKFIENNLSDLNGWGSFNLGSRDSYFIGNKFDRDNHGCTTPDGRKFQSGCETSGWVCLGCTGNVIARNNCELSSNCFYMNGDRGLRSDTNNFFGNYCGGASENCFEITFSFGNVLRENIATMDSQGAQLCKYPFWIGGSIAYLADNTWECSISEDDAFNQSRDSTRVPTNIIRLDNYLGALNAPRIDTLPIDSSTPAPQSRWAPQMVE